MKPNQAAVYAAIALLLVGVFFIDVRMALGFTPWSLYVIPLGLTYWAAHRLTPLIIAALCTLLIFIGYHLSPRPVVSNSVALTNRMVGTLTFWVLGSLIVGYKMLAQRLSHHTEQLRSALQERTQDLGRAVAALREATESGSRGATDAVRTDDGFRIQITEVLAAENRRLQDTVVELEQERQPAQEEDDLERTRDELLQLGRQLEQVQRDLLNQ